MSYPLIVGIDPDSKKHGVAIYQDGKLTELCMLDCVEIVQRFKNTNAVFAIENVCANTFIYTRNQKQSKAAQSKVGMSVGKCQQSQVELMRWLGHLCLEYHLFKPTKANFSNNKTMFERLTSWEKQSNPDTRSAAYFGLLLCK